MTKVMISFERPLSMSEAEMRAWITERARAGEPVLTLDGRDSGAAELLHVELPEGSMKEADEQLTELMMDMRLLGLRPEVVPARKMGTNTDCR
jgi:hypothetical protein